MRDHMEAGSLPKNPLIQESSKLGRSSVLDAALIVLAVIGAIAVAGVFGMWALHIGMMNGMGTC